jgi:hypothetical protein
MRMEAWQSSRGLISSGTLDGGRGFNWFTKVRGDNGFDWGGTSGGQTGTISQRYWWGSNIRVLGH